MFDENDDSSIKRVWGNPTRPSNTAIITGSFFIKIKE